MAPEDTSFSSDWPVYCTGELAIGNPDSNIGICTLWTKKEAVVERVNAADYAVCGNLYSIWGINYLLRNVFLNPRVRYIVLCGADLSRSGDNLLLLMQNGVDDDHRIIGGAGRIDREIPREAIELFQRSVTVVDLRGPKNLKKIATVASELGRLPPFTDPVSFPESQPEATVLPSLGTGFKVEHETVARAWLDLLKLVMMFGDIKPSDYGIDQKELLNVLAVVTSEDPDDVFFPPWLPTAREELDEYYPRVLSAGGRSSEATLQLSFWGGGDRRMTRDELAGVSYTYGGRLRRYRGVSHDQINAMIDKLRKASYTRRAVAITWDPLVDGFSEHPPCLVQLLTHVRRNQLHLTASFRSHDIFGAWPENAFALRKLQKEIAGPLNVGLGPLTIISHSAHVYINKWQTVQELLDNYYPRLTEWQDDPLGNFLISTKEGKIIAEHSTSAEGKTGIAFEGKTARQVYLSIVADQLVSLPEHAAYLGSELQKAELALNFGVRYSQDKPLPAEPHPTS